MSYLPAGFHHWPDAVCSAAVRPCPPRWPDVWRGPPAAATGDGPLAAPRCPPHRNTAAEWPPDNRSLGLRTKSKQFPCVSRT